MDLEETKKLIESKIEAEAVTKNVRSKIKSYIHEKQNLREGFRETFKPLIESQDKVKESVDKEQNELIKQLQKNQLARTEGLDKNRLAITQGFDKMDEVKKWDLQQLPGYEAIEEPEEYQKRDEEKTEEKYERPFFEVPVRMKQKNYFIVLGYPHKIVDDPDRILTVNFKDIGENLNDFNYNYDKDENLITLIGKKPESIAQFKFEDLDKGLEYKEAKDYLDSLNLHYPSVMTEKSLAKINRKLEKAQEELRDFKSNLRNTANIKKIGGLDLAFPLNDKPQTKKLELIDKRNILERYAHSLNNLKMYKENIQSKTGTGILHFNNLHQLLDRLELLSGSILAGNNGEIQEFSQIAHLLDQMKLITKKQLNDLLKKYILNK